MIVMRVWTCTTFQGHWPVGSAAVVVAENELQARLLLYHALKERGLELKADDKLEELKLARPLAVVLCDGDY